jgi:membrane protein DedA with SNARE-associated domain
MGFLDGDTIQHLIAHYGYAAIFLVVMMESTGIPMPGETILISAAALAGTKHALDIRGVIAAAAGGAIVGDNIGFWVGREFGEPLLAKLGYLVGLDARRRKSENVDCKPDVERRQCPGPPMKPRGTRTRRRRRN